MSVELTPLLDAELDPHGHRLGGHDHVDALLDLLERNVGRRRPSLDRNFQQRIPDLGKARDVLFEKGVVHGIAAHQPRQDRSQQERVGAGPHRQMQVGALRGLGAARIDHDHLPVRILADIVEMIARIGKAVGDPGIGADHEQQVAMMHVFGGVAGLAAEHVAVDPEIAGLLLRQRIEDVLASRARAAARSP